MSPKQQSFMQLEASDVRVIVCESVWPWNLEFTNFDQRFSEFFFAENTSFLAIIHYMDVNRGFLSKMHLWIFT